MGGPGCQSPEMGLLVWLQQWGKPTSDRRELERPPGGWSKPFDLDTVARVELHSCSHGAVTSGEGQALHAEHHRPLSLLGKVPELERYRSPNAGIFISFLMSRINAIQAELSRCSVNSCQGRCGASGHSARAKAVTRVSGRAYHLWGLRKASGREDEGTDPSLSVCLWYSQS